MSLSTPRPWVWGQTHHQLAQRLGGPGRARAAWLALGAESLTPADFGARAWARLGDHCDVRPPEVHRVDRSPCGTHKLLVGLPGRPVVETVVIPALRRTTVCVSSQLGCARGCVFCATGVMGLQKQLAPEDIVAQVVAGAQIARSEGLPPARNVVFMGMGEPLDNLDSVRQAVAVLVDPNALGLGPRHVTVSTVGPSVAAVASLSSLEVSMAWSLHTTDPVLRQRLIPRSKAHPQALRDAFLEVLARGRRKRLFVEVTLIDALNHEEVHAEEMAQFLEPMRPRVRINLLPVNPTAGGYRPPSTAAVDRFRRVLQAAGFFCSVRTTRGASSSAACGQLARSGETRVCSGKSRNCGSA